MKKILASAGLTVLGAASLHAQGQSLSAPDKSKFWNVGLAVNGFYDDNYNAAPKNQAEGSWGIEVIPSIGANLLLDQTTIGLNLTYDMRWYEDRPDNEIDQQFVADLDFTHAFSERMNLSVANRFVYANEPDIIDTSIITTPALRSDQTAYHNLGTIAFAYDFSPKYGVEVSYSNGWYDYTQDGPGSLNALMNRLDNKAALNFRWFMSPPTTLLIGYQYQWLDYTSDDSLSTTGPFIDPNIRNYNSHFIYVGADHNFTSEISASVRLGAQITEYDNIQSLYPNVDDSEVTPYADLSLNWIYNPGSYIKGGVRSTLNATDVAYTGAFSPSLISIYPIMNQQSTAAYTTWNHKLTPRWTSTVTGLFQASEYNGEGNPIDGETDYLGLVGINLNYLINSFLSANIGYNWDRLDSDIPGRSYTRNRGYLGLSAKY